ncbi:MAG: NAD(P)-binding domain-containing protein [Boseongicola sp.]|nr:NAD(P)-binding domain-containing protein [Boseongicola sp.]
MSEISVVGLGKMGAALGLAQLKSGRSVTVWNRSADKAGPLVEQGAVLAPSLKDAIAASDVILVCVKNHETAMAMLTSEAEGLSGKTVIDLSTGGAEEAEALVQFLTGAGATWQIGMINAYPSGIGKDETSILCAGPEEVWAATEGFVKTMGGASAYVGTTAAAIPALFSAMFTAR